MERICITDNTLRQREDKLPLSFREQIELCKLLDRLEVSMIELREIRKARVDSLLIKSVVSAVQNAGVAVPVRLGNAESVRLTWEALKECRRPRLQVCAPVSPVQMEYLFHLKPQKMLQSVSETITACLALTKDVEVQAMDATRSDHAFLREFARQVVKAGATVFTVCDSAGTMLPEELSAFIESLRADVPELAGVTLGYSGSNALNLADACTISAIRAGTREVKAAAFCVDAASLPHVVRILEHKGSAYGVQAGVRLPQLERTAEQIASLCHAAGSRFAALKQDSNLQGEIELSAHDSLDAVLAAARRLGYDLNAEDAEKVWTVFQSVVEKKEGLTLRELDRLIATEAMQVPPVYTDVNYVINTGNTVGAMAHMKLRFHGRELEGLSHGDGVIDAAFQSIELATGRHYELDDFQVQAVAEGQEAMGETLVKLRADGKVYSGRGISTDIVGASVMAYINALNKIAYEQEEEA